MEGEQGSRIKRAQEFQTKPWAQSNTSQRYHPTLTIKPLSHSPTLIFATHYGAQTPQIGIKQDLPF
jgi:hypothetical protein